MTIPAMPNVGGDNGTWGPEVVAWFNWLAYLTVTTTAATAYTLVLADAGQIVETTSASAVTLTVPTNASVAFPVGTSIEIHQYGAGQVSFAGAGVNIRSLGGLTRISGQYGTASLRYRGADEWILTGELA